MKLFLIDIYSFISSFSNSEILIDFPSILSGGENNGANYLHYRNIFFQYSDNNVLDKM